MEAMIETLGFLLLSAILTAVFYPAFINFLYRFQLKEAINPDVPRTHFVKAGTPTAAGLLPIGVFLILNLLFNLTPQILLLTGVVGAMAALGLAEDLFKIYRKSRLQRTIREKIVPIVTMSDLTWDLYKIVLFPWNAFREVFRALGSQNVGGVATYQKILYQSAVGALLALWLATVGGTGIWLPLLGKLELGVFYVPLVIFAFLFLVNSVSITDGLDGLVGGLLAIALTAVLSLALIYGKNDLATAAGILVGGLLPFLYFNIFPARVFAGNVGALGWAAAFVALFLLLERSFLLLVIGGVFVAEGLSVVIQIAAVKMGRPRVFLMAPLHHHFEIKGWVETKVSMRFWLVGAFLAFLGLFLAFL
uniref:Phospho-N-acetylmuramoyl-pentapeptide-transferase n=1 Tax=candidate division WWE3 bacterium TaxID=2053526 RepID=A0A832E0P1_UNCKA